MSDVVTRIMEDMAGRIGGPMTFRLILQPLVAAFLAIRAGMIDARMGRPPYFWTILVNPADRGELIHEGWKAVAKVFVLAVLIDIVYQLIVLRWVYPFETLLVAFLLACVPYLLLRGLTNRIARTAQQPSPR